MAGIVSMEAISEKQYRSLHMENSTDHRMIIEFDGNHIDIWDDIYKVVKEKFLIDERIINLYHLEDILLYGNAKGVEPVRELYIIFRNLDIAMKRKSGVLGYLRDIFSFNVHRDLDALLVWTFFAGNVMPRWAVETEAMESWSSIPLELCKLYYVQETSWTETIDPPHNEIIYLEESEYDLLRDKIVTDEDTFVVDLTDAQDTEVFIHVMSKYVNGKINSLDELEQYMLRGLRDTTKPKQIVFFLKDFLSYCRNEDKYYDDVPLRVGLSFIKYCICYWFYESTPIPESWKKEFTLYVTEEW